MLKDQIKTIINSCNATFTRFLVPDIDSLEVTEQHAEQYEPGLIHRRKITKKSCIIGFWVITGLFLTNIISLIHSGSILLQDQYEYRFDLIFN